MFVENPFVKLIDSACSKLHVWFFFPTDMVTQVIFHLLLCFPNEWTCQGWARSKLGARKLICIFLIGAEAQVHGLASAAALPGEQSRSGIGAEPMGPDYSCRLLLTLLSCRADCTGGFSLEDFRILIVCCYYWGFDLSVAGTEVVCSWVFWGSAL